MVNEEWISAKLRSGLRISHSRRSKARGDQSPNRQVETWPRLYMVRVCDTSSVTYHPQDRVNFISLPFLLEATTDLLFSLWVSLNYLEFYINGIMQYALLIVWLLSLSIVLLTLTHVVYIDRSFLFVVKLLSLGIITLRLIHVVAWANKSFFFFSYWVIFYYMI